MCGIVGIASNKRVNRRALSAAIRQLAHRGPDGSGAFVDDTGTIALGHTRLSIIELSDAGAQPMTSRNGRYTITYNGEIYNYREIRAELVTMGVRFRGQSDTEVLLEGYAKLGPDILGKLNGIFAFAIHDAEKREVFLARDHIGAKPLYYAETPTSVVFGSEIKAFMGLADVSREIDPGALRRYLTFLWCPGEQTLFKAVKKLDPGGAMILRDGAVARRWTYWSPPVYAPRRDWTARQCAEELRQTVNRCVTRQMVSDVPVGAFLSGGLDSSCVVAAARAQAPDILCFTIDAGREEGSEEDLPYARSVAAALGVELKEIRVDSATMAERLAEMPYILDEPLADPACLNVLFIAELARSNGVKVLLSGAGGDDLFTGYRRHTALEFDGMWDRTPTGLRRAAASGVGRMTGHGARLRRLKKALASGALDGDRRISANFAWGPFGLPDDLLSPELRERCRDEDVFEPMQDLLAAHPDLPPIEKCLLLEQRFFLADHNLTYTDKMSMMAGVETRVPLLDIELIEFAAQIPVEWKHRGLTTKWILKQSQVGHLPAPNIFRPKTGFGAPLRDWLHSEMRGMVEDLTSPSTIRARGLFDLGSVARLQSAYARGEIDGAYTLLSVMCVELWCRRFVDADYDAAA
jgi:asparagine synthase (glutamine-hydrolysing)